MSEKNAKKRGVVYIMSNAGMPGCLKIGTVSQESGLKDRKRSLQSGSPHPYVVEYAAVGHDAATIEKKLHEVHAANRVYEGGGIEWFKIDLKSAKATLDICKGLRVLSVKKLAELLGEPTTPPKSEVNPQAPKRTLSTKSARRPRFTFDSIGVPVGARLTYVSDPQVTARVVSQAPPRIEFNGETTTLSAVAEQIVGYPVSGPLYWKYNGRTINAIRNGK